MSTHTNKVVNIYTESSPNPNSLKFVLNFMIMDEGISKDYSCDEVTSKAPLAHALFANFDFVKRVFYMSNFITVTKNDQTEWFEVKNQIQQFIKNWFLEEKPVLLDEREVSTPTSEPEGYDLEKKIRDILDEYIKPAVEMDGGAIKLSSFKEGVVKVSLQGACSGCPSSTVTLKNGIETLLKRMIPEVKEVIANEE